MGTFSRYDVQLATLADGHYEQDFVCDTQFFRDMENSDVLACNVGVHMLLDKKNEAYRCVFICKGSVEVACDRCLEALEIPIDTTYEITVKYGEAYNDDADNVLIIPQTEARLNVANILADTIILALPLRRVHPVGGCDKAMTDVLSLHNGNVADADDDDECGCHDKESCCRETDNSEK